MKSTILALALVAVLTQNYHVSGTTSACKGKNCNHDHEFLFLPQNLRPVTEPPTDGKSNAGTFCQDCNHDHESCEGHECDHESCEGHECNHDHESCEGKNCNHDHELPKNLRFVDGDSTENFGLSALIKALTDAVLFFLDALKSLFSL